MRSYAWARGRKSIESESDCMCKFINLNAQALVKYNVVANSIKELIAPTFIHTFHTEPYTAEFAISLLLSADEITESF